MDLSDIFNFFSARGGGRGEGRGEFEARGGAGVGS